MRLWTLHPKYLDSKGLVAAWREGLLAQAVLRGKTIGYTRHPQLARFRASSSPVSSVGAYLSGLRDEATRRGYRFDGKRIVRPGRRIRLPATTGQLAFEWRHLRAKLEIRDPEWLSGLGRVLRPIAHPVFRMQPGGIADWEVAQKKARGAG
jgi:hypothetical protein